MLRQLWRKKNLHMQPLKAWQSWPWTWVRQYESGTLIEAERRQSEIRANLANNSSFF